MKAPTERDVKRLFALSLNQCAFPSCLTPIFGLSDEMVGEICHIKARSPDGARYDPAQTDEERHAFGNLILLCRNHHKTVDDQPDKYTAEWLTRIKREHEQNGSIELDQRDARLALRLLEAHVKLLERQTGRTTINQSATGERITQVAGDYHHYAQAPKPKW